MKGIDWVITKWSRNITESEKDEYVNKDKVTKEMIHKFRLLDDDGVIYAYGFNKNKDFEPLDYYQGIYGCVNIEYKNTNNGEYYAL